MMTKNNLYLSQKRTLTKNSIICFEHEMSPKVTDLKNRKKLHILDLKQLKGGQKFKFFVIIFVVPCYKRSYAMALNTPLCLPFFTDKRLLCHYDKKF